MHPLLAPLKRICQDNLIGSKNLIMPSYLDGNALKKSLSREGFFALNLNVTTLFDLARDYCDDYILKNRLKILDNFLGQIFILQTNIELNYLEEVFFRKIILPESKVIYLPAPRDLKKPTSFYFFESYKEEKNYPEKPFDYLYNIDKMPSNLPEKINIELIQSHGEYNEIKGIIRKIKS